jgi:hypothetical protein
LTTTFVKELVTNPNCVFESMKLHKNHGDSPDGTKLRAAKGAGSLGVLKYPIWDPMTS